MLIGVISDTHWTRASQYLDAIDNHFRQVERILHAGDVVDASILERLGRIAPVTAVRGNCENRELSPRLQHTQLLKLNGINVGMFHGWEVNLGDPEAIVEAFPTTVQLIIHGHTHVPVYYEHNGVTIFNPGSPSEPRKSTPASLGLLWIGDDGFQLRHIPLEEE